MGGEDKINENQIKPSSKGKRKLLSGALVVSENSNSTACERKVNEDKESKVLLSDSKRRRVACAI